VDQAESFAEILEGLSELAGQMPIVFPAHPRTRKQILENGLQSYFGAVSWEGESLGIMVIDPQGYLDFLCLMKHAGLVVTDSGGIQEETTGPGMSCVTVRENTERPVTTETGTNLLAGVSGARIRDGVQRQLKRTGPRNVPKFWDGRAAERIVEILVQQAPTHGLGERPLHANAVSWT
jgi:UDP-N-acetylglucosamine 2-epimerase (non-hydrolysing)